MNELDRLYVWLLNVGLLVARDAVASRNLEWAHAELEFLHNMPSLIGEANVERHRYFWFKERPTYLEWISVPGREEIEESAMTFYGSFLDQMEPIITRLIAEHDSRQRK